MIKSNYPTIVHHGGFEGVTGSCHELRLSKDEGVLIDCGLFQGSESSVLPDPHSQTIDFSISHIKAVFITHVHLDHIGRLPYLLAAGYEGPIYCSKPSSLLLRPMLQDAIKIGFTRDKRMVEKFLVRIERLIVPVEYGEWQEIEPMTSIDMQAKFKPAGHILGSAYIECRFLNNGEQQKNIFSGDLGAPYAPLLPAPAPAYGADLVVLESTYGNRIHKGRKERRKELALVLKKALADNGVVLIPAFSLGRTQEILYEIEDILHRFGDQPVNSKTNWQDLEILIDSPLAAKFTSKYKLLKKFWDKEAKRRIKHGRHPLSFEQLTTIESHNNHLYTVDYLKRRKRAAVVVAGSGMCNGGRIVNYLKAFLPDEKTDVILVGYQAGGTNGRDIQKYGPRKGYVILDGKKIKIKAAVHTISGYSAHADQKNLVNFIKRMRKKPKIVRLVHGDRDARQELKEHLLQIRGIEEIVCG